MNDPVFPDLIRRTDRGNGKRGDQERIGAAGPLRACSLDEACWLRLKNVNDGGRSSRLDDVLRSVEREIIRFVLIRTGGNQSRAGRILAVKPSTLSWKIRKLGLDSEFGRYVCPEWGAEVGFPGNQNSNR